MAFRTLDESYRLIRILRGVVLVVEKRDRDLGSQIRRAASSVVLNLAEGRGRSGRDQVRFFRIARGSALEVEAGLRLALEWGHASETELGMAIERADVVCRMATVLVRRAG